MSILQKDSPAQEAKQAAMSSIEPIPDHQAARPADPAAVRRTLFLVAAGLFVTTFGQPNVVGEFPFRLLFKNELHLTAGQQAVFVALSTFAWYFKPLAGLICDSFPLFGTRRRSYLLVSSGAAVLLWLGFGVAPRTYLAFFWLMLLLNAVM